MFWRQLQVDEPLHDERLEQLERHQLGQAALVQLQRGADDDDRTARVVDALAQQVLAEAALLALQHVGERLQRPVARAGDGPAAAAVVEQGVDGLLQHALLVVDDDLGRAQVEQALQPVVAVDDPAVEVVQVGRGEAAAVELHHRAQLRRDHRDGVEDHGPGVVDPTAVLVAAVEGRDDLQALDGLLLALGRQRPAPSPRVDGVAELDLLLVEVDAVDELRDGVGAHAAPEVLAVAVAELTPQQLVLDDLAGVEVAELVEGPLHQRRARRRRARGWRRSPSRRRFWRAFTSESLAPSLSSRGDSSSSRLEAPVDGRAPLLLDLGELLGQLGLEVGQVGVAPLVVDPGDQVGGEVDDLLQLLGLQLLTGLDAGTAGRPATSGAPQVPDVHDGGGQLDVAHALAPDLRAGDLDAAALADDALEPDALVLAAVALPVLRGTEDLLAEEADPSPASACRS